ncbi:MAG: methyltransferase [Bacteroidetes bacterium]|nr:methyltransferase [Bacteroidota bacterium]
MSNAYFQFKKFTIRQDRCAMKVSTDACIQGAWTPVPSDCKHILDIGAGTGLLSLMLAQRAPDAQILALENQSEARHQAAENMAASEYAQRLHILHADASAWSGPQTFDLILCNPPFFKNSLLGPNASRNAARHITSLDAQCLIRLSLEHLTQEGNASFLWPLEAHEQFVALACQSGLYLQQELRIAHRPDARPARVVGIYGRNIPEEILSESLLIKDESDSYSAAFQQLLQPYYLFF